MQKITSMKEKIEREIGRRGRKGEGDREWKREN